MGKRYKVRTGEGTPEFDYDTKIPFKFRGVDLIDGTTYDINGYDDLKNNAIVFKCRYCNEEYSWDKKESTEDQWTSGLCKKCFLIEQQKGSRKEFEYIHNIRLMKDETGKLIIPPKDQEWEVKYQDGTIKKCAMEDVIPLFCHSEEKLRERYERLKYAIQENWTLIRFEESHIEDFEINLVDKKSIFFKIIKNRDLEEHFKRMIRYEQWKANNFEIFMRTLSECSLKTNEEVLEFLISVYPDSKSPGGSRWTLQAVKYLREYIDQIPKDISREWEKWENTVRVMLEIRQVLVRERLLIFKDVAQNHFSYQEIDALIKFENKVFLIDAKYKGGDVNPEKGQIYIQILEKLGYTITAVLFITAEEGNPKRLADKIYAMPYMWFKTIYESPNKKEMLSKISRVIEIANDIYRRRG